MAISRISTRSLIGLWTNLSRLNMLKYKFVTGGAVVLECYHQTVTCYVATTMFTVTYQLRRGYNTITRPREGLTLLIIK